jgi:hypothetical protein
MPGGANAGISWACNPQLQRVSFNGKIISTFDQGMR